MYSKRCSDSRQQRRFWECFPFCWIYPISSDYLQLPNPTLRSNGSRCPSTTGRSPLNVASKVDFDHLWNHIWPLYETDLQNNVCTYRWGVQRETRPSHDSPVPQNTSPSCSTSALSSQRCRWRTSGQPGPPEKNEQIFRFHVRSRAVKGAVDAPCSGGQNKLWTLLGHWFSTFLWHGEQPSRTNEQPLTCMLQGNGEPLNYWLWRVWFVQGCGLFCLLTTYKTSLEGRGIKQFVGRWAVFNWTWKPGNKFEQILICLKALHACKMECTCSVWWHTTVCYVHILTTTTKGGF